MRRLGLALVFVWFFAGGIAHFAFTDTFLRIVPPWVPWPRLAVQVSGAFEILGALAVLLRRSRALAGWALIALTVCVTPANVYMWMNAALFPALSESLLLARLVLQALLIACIGWSTRTEGPGAAAPPR